MVGVWIEVIVRFSFLRLVVFLFRLFNGIFKYGTGKYRFRFEGYRGCVGIVRECLLGRV